MFQITVSPFNSQYALLACDMSGDYRTTDGGASWQMINHKHLSSSIALRPTFSSSYTHWVDNSCQTESNTIFNALLKSADMAGGRPPCGGTTNLGTTTRWTTHGLTILIALQQALPQLFAEFVAHPERPLQKAI